MDTPLDSWLGWEPLPGEEAAEAVERLTGGAAGESDVPELSSAHVATLPFYGDHRLVCLEFEGESVFYGLHGPDHTFWLDGESTPIHLTNEVESLVLTDDVVRAYVRFFLCFLRSDDQAFIVVESESQLAVSSPQDSGVEEDGDAYGDAEGAEQRLRELAGELVPMSVPELDGYGGWRLGVTVVYDAALFAASFSVNRSGEVEMIDDVPIAELEGITVAPYPVLRPFHPAPSVEIRDACTLEVPDIRLRDGSPFAPREGSGTATRDRDVTEALVGVLLEDAIREADDSSQRGALLQHFNAKTRGESAIDRLRRLVIDSVPVIIIESDIPLVEEFVAGLVDGPDRQVSRGSIERASVAPSDELRCVVEYGSSAKLRLLSFHAYHGLFDAERTAHELALGEATVLIGCERATAVPEPLRRIADLTLKFPRMDRGRFVRAFKSIFDTEPPSGWDEAGSDWTKYLAPTDFHIPRRLGLEPDTALELLRQRVEARLTQISAKDGPDLDELHGMGEARQVCEDFVTDIAAAQAGEIPWSAVDSGLLMFGAPGTGKTTLARAMAKSCGVKFISTSAANWQAAGTLDVHLQAMRADFSEARRYAPAILFIDEIDSIGSRELLGGDRNQIYQTEVINALLEQIQGMDASEPVIVVGATNYLDRVDPALRRAGRLDQAVEIPLPNISGLEKIYAFYLEPHIADDEVDSSVRPSELAALSLGRTGADVEFYVRGAARRARRAGRKITSDDLIAEVTLRPRRPDSVPPLEGEELHRVAVHEAGHAAMRLLSETKGKDIAFVSIVPRANGSLGFVASVPSEQRVMTRRDLVALLEVILAGRAAEEVVFGLEEVSTGAGGESRTSDLAVATTIATSVVCQSGLGGVGGLRWTLEPSSAQLAQIEALLTESYGGAVSALEAHRPLLDGVAAILEEEQEVTGEALRGLLG